MLFERGTGGEYEERKPPCRNPLRLAGGHLPEGPPHRCDRESQLRRLPRRRPRGRVGAGGRRWAPTRSALPPPDPRPSREHRQGIACIQGVRASREARAMRTAGAVKASASPGRRALVRLPPQARQHRQHHHVRSHKKQARHRHRDCDEGGEQAGQPRHRAERQCGQCARLIRTMVAGSAAGCARAVSTSATRRRVRSCCTLASISS
jgi:hypothetical protein